MVGRALYNACYKSGATELSMIMRDTHYDRMCFKSVKNPRILTFIAFSQLRL